MTADVSYFIKGVKTPFPEWLGCAKKNCKDHKKDKIFCHIKPETTIHPIGNGLYECDECHVNWFPPDYSFVFVPMLLTQEEREDLAMRLAELKRYQQAYEMR